MLALLTLSLEKIKSIIIVHYYWRLVSIYAWACLNNTYNVHIAMLHTPIEVHKFDDEESHVWFSHHTALVVFVAKSEWYPVLSIRNFSLKNI